MDPERRQRIERLFEAALSRPPDERASFLAEECGDDRELHSEAAALLAAHERADGILERGVMPVSPFLQDVSIPVSGASASDEDEIHHTGPRDRLRHALVMPGAYLLLSALALLAVLRLRPDWTLPTLLLIGLIALPIGYFTVRARGPRSSTATDAGLGREPGRGTSAQVAPGDPLTPGARVGRYMVIDRLGGGGMGIVYKARDTSLDRHVALKFLPTHLSTDPGARDRFLVEAQAAAALDHPHICTIHEIGSTDAGQMYIAMAYYEGMTVQQKLADGPLPIDEAIDIAIQVARGLARAHERGVIHRDIKPANILVTADGIVKVLDFGVAKLSGIDLTRTGAAVGTISYMSPEQVRGGDVTRRADIWSLGVVLYEMLTGRRPFDADEAATVLHRIVHVEPRAIQTLRPDLPDGLVRVVEGCLIKEAGARYASMEALLTRLGALRPESVGTHTPPIRPSITDPGLPEHEPTPQPEIPAEGERRPASVLVVHLDGYAELVEELRPEELDRLTRRIRLELARAAEQHGGVLNQASDGCFVVLFGLAAGHEDDLPRAVRTALAVRSRLQDGGSDRAVRLRAGLASGTILVRPSSGADERYRVAGSACEIAERLAAHADPGEILVHESGRRQAAAFFELEEDEPFAVRGSRDPITPYRVVRDRGVRTRLDAAEDQGLTAYTGRERELETLRDAFDGALHGEGALVSIVGDAGVGKSRTLLEFRRQIAMDEARMLNGRCQPHGGGTPYLPFIEALGARLVGAGPREAATVIEAVRAIGPELESFIPLYLHLLSIDDPDHSIPGDLEGEHLRAAILDALSAIFTLGSSEPTLLLLEDWHWADGASAEVLLRLAEMVATYPLLIVATSRPDPGLEWGTPPRHYPLYLGPLDPDSSGRIVRFVLGVDEVPAEFVAEIHDRTGGNPFFLEELCKAMLETGAIRVDDGRVRRVGSLERLNLPDTVQGVLRARLDRLSPGTREVVRHAAVIGREFPRDLLRQTLTGSGLPLEDALDSLRRLGLVQQVRVLPEPAFRFQHALTVEAAYDSLLHHQKRNLHGRVARAIEELFADRLDERLDRLAFHFSQAQVWPRAIEYGVRAAERALSFSRFPEALDLFDRALEWIGHLPDDDGGRDDRRIEILFRQEWLTETLGMRDRQARIIDELLSMLEPLGPSARLAEVHLRRGDLNTLIRRFDAAERGLEESLRIARAVSDRVAERNALRSLGLLRWHQRRNEEAIELAEAALAIDRERRDTDGIVVGLSNLGSILKGMGEHQRALEHLFEGLRRVEEAPPGSGSRLTSKRSYLLHNIANIYRVLGDNRKAIDYLEWAASTDTGYLSPIQQSFHLTAMAHIRLQQGKLEESLELYGRAVEISRAARAADGLAHSLRALGTVLVTAGRYDEALPHLTEAADLFDRMHDDEGELAVRQAAATVCERVGRSAEAEAAWRRVREIAVARDDRAQELAAIEGLGRLARPRDPERARALYAEALELAKGLDDRARQAALLNTLGILDWSAGAHPDALERYRGALALFRELGDRPHEGLALNSIGATLRSLGRTEEAVARLEEALETHRATGERLLEAHALAILGEIRGDCGDPGDGAALIERSLEMRRELGDRRGEGWMLCRLASLRARLGEREAARSAAAEAAAIAAEVSDPQLAEACERLELRDE